MEETLDLSFDRLLMMMMMMNTNGDVSVWDMLQSSTVMTAEPVLSPHATFRAHNDCVNGIR